MLWKQENWWSWPCYFFFREKDSAKSDEWPVRSAASLDISFGQGSFQIVCYMLATIWLESDKCSLINRILAQRKIVLVTYKMISDHPQLHMPYVHGEIASDCNPIVLELKRKRPAIELTCNRSDPQSNKSLIALTRNCTDPQSNWPAIEQIRNQIDPQSNRSPIKLTRYRSDPQSNWPTIEQIRNWNDLQ